MATELELFCNRVVHHVTKTSKKKKYLVVTNICFKLYESDNPKKYLNSKYTRVPLKLLTSVTVTDVKSGFGLQVSCDRQGVLFVFALESAELQNSLRLCLIGASKKEGGCSTMTLPAPSERTAAGASASATPPLLDTSNYRSQADIDNELLRLARQMQGGTRMNMKTIAIRPTRERGDTAPPAMNQKSSSTLFAPATGSAADLGSAPAPPQELGTDTTAQPPESTSANDGVSPSGAYATGIMIDLSSSAPVAAAPKTSNAASAAPDVGSAPALKSVSTASPLSRGVAEAPDASTGSKSGIKLSLIEKRNMFFRSISTPFQKQVQVQPQARASDSSAGTEAGAPTPVVDSGSRRTSVSSAEERRTTPSSPMASSAPVQGLDSRVHEQNSITRPPVHFERSAPISSLSAASEQGGPRRRRGFTAVARPDAPLPPLPPTPGEAPLPAAPQPQSPQSPRSPRSPLASTPPRVVIYSDVVDGSSPSAPPAAADNAVAPSAEELAPADSPLGDSAAASSGAADESLAGDLSRTEPAAASHGLQAMPMPRRRSTTSPAGMLPPPLPSAPSSAAQEPALMPSPARVPRPSPLRNITAVEIN
jgi:hypothetical protein